MQKHLLSKSTFIRGHQCLKSLYLYKKRYFLRDPLPDEQRIKFKRGHEVGDLAQTLFPEGVDVRPRSPSQYQKAVVRTSEELENGTEVIYEAGFQFDRVLVFLDILYKENGQWNACEVKSSKAISETYIHDAALQYYVINNSGLAINKFFIAHINEDYILEDELNIHKLFKLVDVTDRALALQDYVKKQIIKEKETLQLEHSPKIDVGPHCHSPYPCDFIGHCWKGVASSETVSIEKQGVLPQVEGKLKFLHISSFRPAIPIYKGTKPYQEIPFQFSLIDEDNELHNYLLPPGQQPEQLYKALSEILNKEDVLVVYGTELDACPECSRGAGYRMPVPNVVEGPDTGWVDYVINLREFFPDFNLSEVAGMILNDNSLNKLKFKKEVLVAEAYSNMVNNEPEDHILKAITYFGNTSVKIIQNLFNNLN